MSKLKVKHKDNQIVVISKLSKIEEINQQELDVMHSKIIRGLMKPTVSKLNRITYLSPNGLTLKNYLANSITINDFFLVFAQVLEVIKSIERNSFNINNLIMNMNYSFVNEKTKELHMVYQPIRTQVISTNVASFLYDIAYSVNLALSEDYNEINRFINFMKSLQVISTPQIEQYILKNYPSIYKQVKRQKPGQSKMLRGDDFYYHQNDFDDKGNSSELMDDDLAGDTALLVEEDDEATSLLVDEEDDEATSLLTEDDEATALLVEPVKNYPYLIRLNTFDRTDVNKPVFRIGKERSYVDYFVQNNSAVSRLHADIITRGNQYFVKDEITTCDFYAENSDGDLLSILFINLSSNDKTYSEDEILREMTTGISSKFENPNTTEPLYQLLGNQLYLYSDVKGKINNKDMCITSYVRFQDEYAIVINITSKNPENNHSISASIDSCN